MPFTELRKTYIAASKISYESRFARLMKHPVKTLLPPILRKLRIQKAVSVPTVWGGTFSGVLPEAVTSEIWRSGTFELPVALSIMKFLPRGGTYIDIGAHFGFFSLFASHVVGASGKVVSIEAMPSTFIHLKNNIGMNAAHQNVTLHQGAAFSDTVELEFRDFGIVASSLNSAFTARDSHNIIKNEGIKVKVQARPADNILHDLDVRKADVIKIDAESSELHVLAGLTNTLKTMLPIIVMEVGDAEAEGKSTDQLLEFMQATGYRAFFWNNSQDLVSFEKRGHVPYANLTFVPDERNL
jgi:FkbM family methyltransferase